MWKAIQEFEGYEVSSDGCVKGKCGTIMKPRINNSGYSIINLWKDGKRTTKTIHKLVALAFVPNPDNKPEVEHLDRNKQNNSVENLTWATRSEQLLNQERTKYKNNTTGVKGLYYVSRTDRWVCIVQRNKVRHQSPYFKERQDAIEWLKLLELQ